MQPNTLCGEENELAVSIRNHARNAAVIINILRTLLVTLSRKYPSAQFRDGARTYGFMMGQGNRLYVEMPAPFLENATAEVRTPMDLIAWKRAGERLVIEVLARAAEEASLHPSDVSIARIVTDYQGNFCGCHLNVLCRTEPDHLASCLLPYLATCVWGKAGGLGPAGFVLSHKARAIHTEISGDTRGANRPILSPRKETLSGNGSKRLHLTSLDATMSDWNSYLMAGSLMVIVKMLDDGACVGPAMTLVDTVSTFRDMDTDFCGQRPVQLACGLEVKPIEIQRYYLEAAETYVAKQPESWMHEFVRHWRHRHDELEHEPSKLSDKLDAFIKMRLFSRILREFGFDLDEFRVLCGAVGFVENEIEASESSHWGSREYYREKLPFVPFHLLDEHLARHRLSWARLPQALKLWWSLQATDLNYHSVKEEGLFWCLRRKGVIREQLVDEPAIQRAMREPPQDTRAKPRGVAIREFASTGTITANWDCVMTPKIRVPLPDPFATSAQPMPIEQPQEGSII